MGRQSKQRARRQQRLLSQAAIEQELAEVRDKRDRLAEVFVKLAGASAAGQNVELSPWELDALLPAVRGAIHQTEIERHRA